MPQLAQLGLVYQSQWFWLLLVLAAIYFFVGRGIVPKVEATVDARDAQIAADLAAAEAARAEADAAEETLRTQDLAARSDARAFSAAAKDQAAKASEAKLAKAAAKTSALLAEAEAKIAASRAKTLVELHEVASEAAQGIVAKVSGASVTAAQAKQTVKLVLGNA
jgi:F-type H+-transporting ATPase subunit b